MDNASDDTVVIPQLVADLMGASAADAQQVANRLIENLRAALDDREAELAAIRWGTERLIYGDYMPTTNALAKALHPSPEVIARFRRKREAA